MSMASQPNLGTDLQPPAAHSMTALAIPIDDLNAWVSTPRTCHHCNRPTSVTTTALLLPCAHDIFHYSCIETALFENPSTSAYPLRRHGKMHPSLQCPICAVQISKLVFVNPELREEMEEADRWCRLYLPYMEDGNWTLDVRLPDGVIVGWELRQHARECWSFAHVLMVSDVWTERRQKMLGSELMGARKQKGLMDRKFDRKLEKEPASGHLRGFLRKLMGRCHKDVEARLLEEGEDEGETMVREDNATSTERVGIGGNGSRRH